VIDTAGRTWARYRNPAPELAIGGDRRRPGGHAVRTNSTLCAGLGLGALAAVLAGCWVAGWSGPAGGSGGAVGALGSTGSEVEPGVAVARLATDGLGAAGIGLALLPLLLGDRFWSGPDGPHGGRPSASAASERARHGALRQAARLGVALAAGWAIVALLALWLQAADAAGVAPVVLSPARLGEYAGQVAAGRGLLLTLACAVLLLGLQLAALVRSARDGARGRARYPELVLGAGLLGVLPGPVTGHAAGHAGHDPAVLAIALHVVAACLWVGGLLAMVLVLAPHRRLVVVALPRFSTVAGYCAATVALTGVLSAAFRLPSPAALVATGYGLLLLAKAGCLAVLLGLGGRARRTLLRRVAGLAGGGAGAAPLVRWLGLELVVMAVVFGLAAALAGAAP
jgi:putative copper resistance protein D